MRECVVAAAHDADVIRLTVPADQDMLSVLAVAVKVVGIRSGLTDVELDAARDAAGLRALMVQHLQHKRDAVLELLQQGAA